MECSRCVRVALYVVNGAGYCKRHRVQAFAHAAEENTRHESEKGARVSSYRRLGRTKRHYGYREQSYEA